MLSLKYKNLQGVFCERVKPSFTKYTLLHLDGSNLLFQSNEKERDGKSHPFQRVDKPCHSEPVFTLAWESPGFSNILNQYFVDFS